MKFFIWIEMEESAKTYNSKTDFGRQLTHIQDLVSKPTSYLVQLCFLFHSTNAFITLHTFL